MPTISSRLGNFTDSVIRRMTRIAPEDNRLYGFLLSFGTGVEVISPPHLRDILAGIAEEIHRKYTKQK